MGETGSDVCGLSRSPSAASDGSPLHALCFIAAYLHDTIYEYERRCDRTVPQVVGRFGTRTTRITTRRGTHTDLKLE